MTLKYDFSQVGLGTDVSGGFDPSILNAIQHASIASKVISMQSNPSDPLKPGYNNRKLSVATLLYLATLGGAHVCGLENDIGSFAPGKSFDALMVKVASEAGNSGLYPGEQEENADRCLRGMLERFLFCGDDRNISRVYVQGQLIGGTDFNAQA
jgi:guanine deaminase